jgi:cell division protein FtsB
LAINRLGFKFLKVFVQKGWVIIRTTLILPQPFFMSFLKKIIPFVANRYFVVSVGFFVWMLFFDQRDFFQQKERSAELKKVEAAKKYYQLEIDKTKKQLNNLQNNPASVEKFARERYLLKREGEEVYLFEDTMLAQNKK